MRELRYSPDQPRDDHGRFGEGTHDPKDVKAAIKNWQATAKKGAVAEARQAEFDKAKAAAKAGDGSNPIVGGIRNETVESNSSIGGKESTYLYRGFLAQPDNPALAWKTGDSVQVLPSSWSTDGNVGRDFATIADWHGKGGEPVTLTIYHGPEDGPVHGIEVGTRCNHGWQVNDQSSRRQYLRKTKWIRF